MKVKKNANFAQEGCPSVAGGSYDFLSRLYWTSSSEDGSPAEGLNLYELYELTAAADRAVRGFFDELGRADLSRDSFDRIQAAFGNARDEMEKQGFINGFRLGVQLAGEVSR